MRYAGEALCALAAAWTKPWSGLLQGFVAGRRLLFPNVPFAALSSADDRKEATDDASSPAFR